MTIIRKSAGFDKVGYGSELTPTEKSQFTLVLRVHVAPSMDDHLVVELVKFHYKARWGRIWNPQQEASSPVFLMPSSLGAVCMLPEERRFGYGAN